MPDRWLGWFVISVIAAVVAPFVVALIYLVWRDNPMRRVWGRRGTKDDARLLLSEFRRRAHGNLSHTMAIENAALHAGVDDPGPAVALLQKEELIIVVDAGTRPVYVRLTPKGLRPDENAV